MKTKSKMTNDKQTLNLKIPNRKTRLSLPFVQFLHSSACRTVNTSLNLVVALKRNTENSEAYRRIVAIY